MKRYQPPGLKRERTITYQGIPEDKFDDVKSEIEREIRRETRENEMREARSVRFASDFVTTPPFVDE